MNFLKNIQFQQLINLLLLVSIGYTNNTLQTNWLTILLLLLFSGVLELIFKRERYIPYSAFITALGIVLMVGWTKWYIPFVVLALALIQKVYLKIDNKHIFNPSNFALILAIVLFYPKALPIVGEIGKESFVVFIVILIGTAILIRVNRYLITLSFLLFYITLNYLVFGASDPYWNLEHFISGLYSTSFIVYIFFMLTDPITTPNSINKQLLFAFCVALISTLLNYYIGVRVWHLFIALFVTTLTFLPLYREFNNNDYKKFIVALLITVSIVVYLSYLKPLYFSM